MALWVALAWLCAPLLASTVLYVIQRMAQLATLFLLAGLLCYVMGRQRQVGGQPRRGLALLLGGFVVFWPLAVLSKENGLLFPLLALVVETFVFRFRGTVATRRFLFGLFALTVLVPIDVVELHQGTTRNVSNRAPGLPGGRINRQAAVNCRQWLRTGSFSAGG